MQEIQNLVPLFDVIRQHNPSFSAELAEDNPALADIAAGLRRLGEKELPAREPNYLKLYLEVAAEAAEGVRAHIGAIEAEIERKLKVLGRIRLTGGVLTALATAIVLAAILMRIQTLEIGSAVIAFLSSVLALFGGYVESFSGGESSISRAKEDHILIIEKLAQANATLLIAKAQQQAQKALESLNLFSDAAGRCLMTGARLGIKTHRAAPGLEATP